MTLPYYSDEEIEDKILKDAEAFKLDISKPINFKLNLDKTLPGYSKNGNSMITLSLTPIVPGSDIKLFDIKDWIMPESSIGLCIKKVSQFLKSIGLGEEFKAGKLPNDVLSLASVILSKTRTGRFELKQVEYDKEDGTKGKKYEIVKYLPKLAPETDPNFNDPIPF